MTEDMIDEAVFPIQVHSGQEYDEFDWTMDKYVNR